MIKTLHLKKLTIMHTGNGYNSKDLKKPSKIYFAWPFYIWGSSCLLNPSKQDLNWNGRDPER